MRKDTILAISVASYVQKDSKCTLTIDIGLAKVLSLFQPQGTRQGLGSRHAVNGRLMDRNASWHDSDFYKMLHYLDVFSHRSADRYISKLFSDGEM